MWLRSIMHSIVLQKPPASRFLAFLAALLVIIPVIGRTVFAAPELSRPLQVCQTINGTRVGVNGDPLILIRDQRLFAFETVGYAELWRTEPIGEISGVALRNETLVVITAAGGDRVEIKALSIATGLPRWTANLENFQPRQLYILPPDQVLIQGNTRIMLLDGSDGRVAGNFEVTGSVIPDKNGPLVADEGSLFEVNEGRRSREIWRHSMMPDAAAEISAIGASDGRVLAGFGNGQLIAVDSNGQEQWRYRVGGRISSVQKSVRGFLVASYDNFLYLFDPKNGRQIWKKRIGGRIVEAPLISDQWIVTADTGSAVLRILTLKKGKQINQFSFADEVVVTGAVSEAGNKLIVPTSEGIKIVGNTCQQETEPIKAPSQKK